MAAFINSQLCPDFTWQDAEWIAQEWGGELVLDGGVMRGTDIAKAIALGADAVGVGKAFLYGLAAGGTPGVRKAIDILRDELERAMGLLGCRTVEELKIRGPQLIRKRSYPGHWFDHQNLNRAQPATPQKVRAKAN